jgi:beta-glucuronidase
LWSPDRPALYRATLTLSDSRGRRLGGYLVLSGIRSIVVTPDGRLELNGRPLSLRGVNLHEQSLAAGAALDPAQLRQLVGWVRELGATVIRAHYPLNPEIEEMADRDGILLWSEIPVYQVSSRYLNQPAWVAQAHALLQQNILTNQNHPSVLLWSIGNELPTPATFPEGRYIAGAVALAHELDPTRPVGMATSAWPGVPCQPAYTPLDVIGHNDYFGWFDAGGGANDDRDALSPFLDSLRACYPSKAIFVTEFGFEGNRHGPVEERGTYEFQADSAAFHLAVFASKPWLSGAMYFPLQDFAARPGWGGGNPWPDPPFVQKGPFDLQGSRKPLFDVLSSIYHATVQIGPARR